MPRPPPPKKPKPERSVSVPQRRPGETRRPRALQLAGLTGSALAFLGAVLISKPTLKGQRLHIYRGQERAAGVCPEPLAAPSDGNLTACVSASSGQTTRRVCSLGLQHTAAQVRRVPEHTLVSSNKKVILILFSVQ